MVNSVVAILVTNAAYLSSRLVKSVGPSHPFGVKIVSISLSLFFKKVSPSDVKRVIFGTVNSSKLSGVDFFVSSTRIVIVVNNSLSVLHGINFDFSGSTFRGMNLICMVTPATVSPVCFDLLILVECRGDSSLAVM